MKGRAKLSAESDSKDIVEVRGARAADFARLLDLIREYYRYDGIAFDAKRIAPARPMPDAAAVTSPTFPAMRIVLPSLNSVRVGSRTSSSSAG